MFAWYSQLLVKKRQEVLGVMVADLNWQFLVCRLLSMATSEKFIIFEQTI